MRESEIKKPINASGLGTCSIASAQMTMSAGATSARVSRCPAARDSEVSHAAVLTSYITGWAGHPVIAVTSLQHTNAVTPKHSSGKRLSEIADIVIDNRAPFGDTTIGLGDGLSAGAVSSITAAYIAQLLTLGAAQRLRDAGEVPPLYISANIPGGDRRNDALKARYGERIAGLA